MSFHAGQTFTFGEQPSATKWQYLWDNDYALADGSGISDNAIDSRHYVDGSIDPEHLANTIWGWRELGRATASGGANPTTLDTGTFTAYKYLCIKLLQFSGGAALESRLRFNADSGNNYQYRTIENGGADTNFNAQSGVSLGSNTLEGMHGFFEMHNVSNKYKVGSGLNNYWAAGNTAIYRNTQGYKWENNSSQITRVQMVAASGSYKDGSELIVLGHN